MQHSLQPSFDDLGTHLSTVTWCVFDLETTGIGEDAAITEIGAVKICGGEFLGEFQTLVNPGRHIPANITLLTGITDAMVSEAPPIQAVLPSFLEFSRGCVLVAHNASFDVGFIKRACQAHDYSLGNRPVIDTVALARQVLASGEVRNVKLATLAQHFGVPIPPTHRALDDARATTHVLHALMERVGNRGVSTLEDLIEYTTYVPAERRAKRVWASTLPERPGVYYFYSAQPEHDEHVLYVGKSRNIRKRVATYFTSSESRKRMDEMVRVATGVRAVECATDLEARIRELRMIDAHQPRYNRRSKRQHRISWIKLTRERFPRLSIVRAITDDDATYWGPFSSKQRAYDAAEAIYHAFPIRECTQSITATSISDDCVLADLKRCLAPCRDRHVPGYDEVIAQVRQAMTSDVTGALEAIGRDIARLVAAQRFEEAAVCTERARLVATTTRRFNHLAAVARCPQIIAVARTPADAPTPGWQIHIIRYGRLAAAGVAPRGVSVRETADVLLQVAETVPMPRVGFSCSVEELATVASWLETPGVRLLDIDGEWSLPIRAGIEDDDLARIVFAGSTVET